MSWSYRTGEVTQRVIPAAKDGADFQHGDNDETVKSRGDGVGTPESGRVCECKCGAPLSGGRSSQTLRLGG